MAKLDDEDTDQRIFVAHSNERSDADFVSYLIDKLEERRILTWTNQRDFPPGRDVFESINEAIRHCRKTLLVITQKSLQSHWFSLEMILALEKSQRHNRISVVLLVKDKENVIDVESLSKLKMFSNAPLMRMKSDTLQSHELEELISHLNEDVSVDKILPAGNLAHGLVWSHYTGLHQYLLPELEELIESSSWYREKPDRFPKKLYELIPESCECPGRISDNTGRIEWRGKLAKLKFFRAGNKREIEMSVYSIKDVNGEEFYCVAEHPSSLSAISKMEKETHFPFGKEDKWLQIGRYYYTMNSILNHPKIEGCHEKARLLLYNEKRDHASEVLLKAIKQDLEMSELGKRVNEQPLDRLNSVVTDQNFLYDAALIYSDDKCCQGYASAIAKFLRQRDMRILDDESSSGSLLRRIADCRWVIPIITQTSTDDKILTLRMLSALTNGVSEHKVRVIPVIAGDNVSNIPETIRWITYIHASHDDSRYLERLHKTLTGADIPIYLDTHLPAGDIAYGLAVSYVVNYLQIILKSSFAEQIDAAFQEESFSDTVKQTDSRCPHKMYIIVPESRYFKDKLSDVDPNISPFKILEKYRDQTGVVDRPYLSNMYRITHENTCKVYFFVGHFAAPVLCMEEMLSLNIGGLHENDVKVQAKCFYDYLERILNSPVSENIRDKCELVWWEAKRTLSDEMVTRICRST